MLRRQAALLICALAVGCAGPTEPESPTGAWTLVSVDGAALPAEFVSNVNVVSGTLELNADGTYRERTHADAEGTMLSSNVQGEWRLNGNTIFLLDRAVGLPFAGQWSGATLEVNAARVMRYAR